MRIEGIEWNGKFSISNDNSIRNLDLISQDIDVI